MKQCLIDLEMFPVGREDIWKIFEDDEKGQEVRRLAREHGWPDRGKFVWEKYLVDVEEKRKEWRVA